jgi:hypothetical protein
VGVFLASSLNFSRSAAGAVAESFCNKQLWIPEVFLTPAGDARVLALIDAAVRLFRVLC